MKLVSRKMLKAKKSRILVTLVSRIEDSLKVKRVKSSHPGPQVLSYICCIPMCFSKRRSDCPADICQDIAGGVSNSPGP